MEKNSRKEIWTGKQEWSKIFFFLKICNAELTEYYRLRAEICVSSTDITKKGEVVEKWGYSRSSRYFIHRRLMSSRCWLCINTYLTYNQTHSFLCQLSVDRRITFCYVYFSLAWHMGWARKQRAFAIKVCFSNKRSSWFELSSHDQHSRQI